MAKSFGQGLGQALIPGKLLYDNRKGIERGLFGGSQRKGNIDLLSPEQQQFLSGMLGGQQQGQAQNALSGLLQPQGLEEAQAAFQKSTVDPAMQTLQQQILPMIQEKFAGGNASSSSALNQALAQTATDLSTQLGGQFGQFFQNQQNRAQQGQGAGLNLMRGLTGQTTFTPHMRQTEGVFGPLLNTLVKAGMSGGA